MYSGGVWMRSWRRLVHSTGGYLGVIDDDPPAGASVCVSTLPPSPADAL